MKTNNLRIKGTHALKIFKGDELIETRVKKNMVVFGGLNVIAALLGGAGGSLDHAISKIGFGISAASPGPADSSLTNQFTKAIASTNLPGTGLLEINWTLENGEYNGNNIQEYGLFINNGADVMFSRVLDTPIAKSVGIRLVGTWTLEITNQP